MRRRAGFGVRGKLIVLTLCVAAAAVLLAGWGVTQVAWLVVRHGDPMAAKLFPEFQRQTLRYLAWVSVVAFVVAAGAAWALSTQFVRPLLRLQSAAASIASGDYAARVPARARAGRDEIQALSAAVNRMAAGLDEAEGMRRDLVTRVAQELRTPLTQAQGLVAAMRDGHAPADASHLDGVAEELSRLMRLVEALRRLSASDRVAPGGLELSPVDVGAVAADVASAMAPVFEQKRQVVDVRRDAAAVAPGDRDALVQILVNLLENASAYSPDGSRIAVRAARNGGSVTLEVTNGGVEIHRDDLPHVFERFYRSDPSRARAAGGAGVGLAIVSNLVRAHGGSVTARSGGGSTVFTVTLPAMP